MYVIFFVTLLSVLGCGYMAVSRYHISSALKNRAYVKARLTTRMIHNSFCEAVRLGESDALRLLMDEITDDSLKEENDPEDLDPESLDLKKRDTDNDLEEKEYITQGEGSYTDEEGNPCSVRIRLKADPISKTAFVDTWTQIADFSLHLESEVLLKNIP